MMRNDLVNVLFIGILSQAAAAIADVHTGDVGEEAVLFIDVTSSAGITSSGIDQGSGGGVGWIDFDNDSWQDLYVPNSGTVTGGESRLFRNLGDANDDGIHDGFVDISAVAGDVMLSGKASAGVAVADYNNDGYDDILVLNTGSSNSLLKNNGDGTFTDASVTAGLSEVNSMSFNGAFGDVDGDGDLDVLIGNWQFGDLDYFINQLAETGVATFVKQAFFTSELGSVFGTTMSDYDFDGDLDVIIAIDFNVGRSPKPAFYKNDGAGNFLPDTIMPILEVYGMGVAVGDYDNNTRLDYYVTSITDIANSVNELVSIKIDGTPAQTAAVAGVTGRNAPATGLKVFWGTAFLDVDNDGNLDLYAANDDFNTGTASNRLYMNNGEIDGDVTFTEKSTQSNTAIDPGLGLAIADYDNDGRMDMVVQGDQGIVVLLKNITADVGNEWLKLQLFGDPSSNFRAVGAKVRITSTSASGDY